ncbi:MAG: zinc-ribbon domain-containing protein [Thermoanaerobacteraceae bacterium]|nr:zinc-ribbon domain-containing protein [Thermoanaerobacteraceae bacterium]
MYEDKVLVCKDCGKEFVFTAGEQQFYAEKGFQNEPVRCKECRDIKKQRFNSHNNSGRPSHRNFNRG